MTIEPVVTPLLTSSDEILVDWLELTAFFNERGLARLDDLLDALIEQEEMPEDDIGKRDRELDRFMERLEKEISVRRDACDDTYPFVLSEDAKELALESGWNNERFSFYIVCLLTSHLSKNSLFDFKTPDRLVQKLRNRIFQIVSTLAMAGLAQGGAGSIGWPREDGQTVLETLKRAEKRGAGFKTRNELGEFTPSNSKDGGIDVISWTITGRPPPVIFYYAQAASGHNWSDKSVRHHHDAFERNYFQYPPPCNKAFATLIPFKVDDENWTAQNTSHKAVLDRTRLPPLAQKGLALGADGTEMDENENMSQVTAWIRDMRKFALN